MRAVLFVSALLIAVGLSLAGWFVGDNLTKSRTLRDVTVKGLSERDVKADLGFWPIRFITTGATLDAARAQLAASENSVRTFLTSKGVADSEIQVQNIMVEDRAAGYNSSQTPEDFRFALTEDLLVTTGKVDALGDATKSVGDLLAAGVVFSADSYSAGASYVFTGLAGLKNDMLKEATNRAKESATQLAGETGAKLGAIETVNQGVFEIAPAVEIPNDRPEKQVNKKVRVVTTITYFLTN